MKSLVDYGRPSYCWLSHGMFPLANYPHGMGAYQIPIRATEIFRRQGGIRWGVGAHASVSRRIFCWLVVTGTWLWFFMIFPYMGNFIIPIDVHIFERGRYTTNQCGMDHGFYQPLFREETMISTEKWPTGWVVSRQKPRLFGYGKSQNPRWFRLR